MPIMVRWCGGTFDTSSPLKKTWPEYTVESPMMALRRVVFPTPLGPTMTVTSPSGALKSMS